VDPPCLRFHSSLHLFTETTLLHIGGNNNFIHIITKHNTVFLTELDLRLAHLSISTFTMVTFEDLPLEIRYMILEKALPVLPPHPWPSDFQDGDKRGREYRRAVLNIAATSRSILADVCHCLRSEICRENRFRDSHIKRDVLCEKRCRACPANRWGLYFGAMKCLKRVLDSLTSGITAPD